MRIVNMARLNRSLRTAIADFEACGLYTDELHAVPVRLTLAGRAYGWCWNTGEIDIPAVSLARLGEIFGRPRFALRDILRHEMAHALAHVHPEVVDNAEFRDVFGAPYWSEWETPHDYDPDLFLTG